MSVNLLENQRLILEKRDQSPLSKFFIGLGWLYVVSPRGILNSLFTGWLGNNDPIMDIDVSAYYYDESGCLSYKVSCDQNTDPNGALTHVSDKCVGGHNGDDAQIVIDTDLIDASVHSIVFAISSLSGGTMPSIDDAYCHVVDSVSRVEFAQYALTKHNGAEVLIVAKLSRVGHKWKFQALDRACAQDKLESFIANLI